MTTRACCDRSAEKEHYILLIDEINKFLNVGKFQNYNRVNLAPACRESRTVFKLHDKQQR